MELVDYNETMLKTKPAAKARTRRSRRGGKAATNPQAATTGNTPVKAKETENTSDNKE
jgi:large subunit ribosomal protein L17